MHRSRWASRHAAMPQDDGATSRPVNVSSVAATCSPTPPRRWPPPVPLFRGRSPAGCAPSATPRSRTSRGRCRAVSDAPRRTQSKLGIRIASHRRRARVQRDPACKPPSPTTIMPVRLRGHVQLIDALGRERHGAVVAERHRGRIEVVVDRLERRPPQAHLEEIARDRERPSPPTAMSASMPRARIASRTRRPVDLPMAPSGRVSASGGLHGWSCRALSCRDGRCVPGLRRQRRRAAVGIPVGVEQAVVAFSDPDDLQPRRGRRAPPPMTAFARVRHRLRLMATRRTAWI